MKRENASKIKLLKILEILRQDSDEDRPLSTSELCSKLKEQGIVCDRRVLASDIARLVESGYDIIQVKESGLSTKYFIADRSFDVPELRILMDAVQAASFITPKKTGILLDKIAELGGSHRAALLKRNIWFNTTKHTNEDILYIVNEIDNAITNGKQLSFIYFDYTAEGKRDYRKNGERYTVNPITTVFTNDNYYLVCYSDKHKDSVAHYRIDRMEKVNTESKDITPSAIAKQFDPAKHYNEVFGMFTGETEQVTFEIDTKLLDAMIDRFGENINFTAKENGKLTFTAQVQISPQFFGWCCSFGELLKVVAPTSTAEAVKTHITNLKNLYC
ncbi:MAG: WYL domain-containing transcriptional regulator [Eubacterium sp.]|nr:WYL domain-containing transcriptional regulator [Eubacterium sp.]